MRDREREKPPNERRREQLPVTLTYAFVMGMGKRRSNVPPSSFCQFQRRVKSIQNYWQQFILNPAVTPPSVTPPPPKTLNQGRPLALICIRMRYSDKVHKILASLLPAISRNLSDKALILCLLFPPMITIERRRRYFSKEHQYYLTK